MEALLLQSLIIAAGGGTSGPFCPHPDSRAKPSTAISVDVRIVRPIPIATREKGMNYTGYSPILHCRRALLRCCGTIDEPSYIIMNETQFEALYRDTLVRVEDAIELLDIDLDFETVNDILTVTFDDGSAVIITKQSGNNQLWLAARSGGFHFEYHADSERWLRTSDGVSFEEVFNRVCREQGGIDIDL